MKILCFVDTHGNDQLIKNLIKKGSRKDIDLLVCCGDLTNWGMGLEKLILRFKILNKPLLIIHGNHEDEDSLKEICKKNKFCLFLHKRSYKINDYVFFGYGGGGFSYHYNDLERIISKFKSSLDKNDKVILFTHAPIYNTRTDFLPGIGHKGSKSIRRFIETVKPMVALCGHFHETKNVVDRINKTIIINPGPRGKIIII